MWMPTPSTMPSKMHTMDSCSHTSLHACARTDTWERAAQPESGCRSAQRHARTWLPAPVSKSAPAPRAARPSTPWTHARPSRALSRRRPAARRRCHRSQRSRSQTQRGHGDEIVFASLVQNSVAVLTLQCGAAAINARGSGGRGAVLYGPGGKCGGRGSHAAARRAGRPAIRLCRVHAPPPASMHSYVQRCDAWSHVMQVRFADAHRRAADARVSLAGAHGCVRAGQSPSRPDAVGHMQVPSSTVAAASKLRAADTVHP